jgi:1-acyl-sn-glycerol-3-phosphate acyltransferase
LSGMTDAPGMYRALRRILPKLMVPYFHLQVEGLENIPSGRPAILASNHLSFIDSLVLPLFPEHPVYFLGKADYWDSWRTRWFFSSTGVVPVKRDAKGGDGALETGVEILSRGDLVGIYPEGTRSPDGRLYRGKTGPVRMALEAQVPIVPVGLSGTDRAMPTGSYLPKREPITIRYGRPLDLSRYHADREDPFVLRSATDELMFEIMMLSGQEYVDEYASNVKKGRIDLRDDLSTPAPAATRREDGGQQRRAS